MNGYFEANLNSYMRHYATFTGLINYLKLYFKEEKVRFTWNFDKFQTNSFDEIPLEVLKQGYTCWIKSQESNRSAIIYFVEFDN